MALSKESRQKLKSALPKNYAAIIKQRTEKSVGTVYNVMRGDSDDIKVLDALITLAAEEQMKERHIDAKAEAVLNRN